MNNADMLLLHGFMGSPLDWKPVQSGLDCESTAPALPGHGGGPCGDSLGEDAARCLPGWLQACAPRPLLAGYSLGGRFALELVRQAPERFRGLALLGASPGIRDETRRQVRRAVDAQRASRLLADFGSFLEEWYAMPLFAGLRKSAAYPDIRERRLQGNPAALARAIQVYSPGLVPAQSGRPGGTDFPLLYLYGREDPVYAPLAEGLLREWPGVDCRGLPGAGHALLEEVPAAVAGALEDFRIRTRNKERPGAA